MQNVSRKGLYKEDEHFSSEDMMLNVSRRGLCLCGGHFFSNEDVVPNVSRKGLS